MPGRQNIFAACFLGEIIFCLFCYILLFYETACKRGDLILFRSGLALCQCSIIATLSGIV